MKFDDATSRQVDAANPDVSTWLSANAGSGKTRVLTDRVARLLLAGVRPQNILCLTYTKAAASEMQNRLFKRLGAWAMMEERELRQSLSELGVDSNSLPKETLRKARTLFALAIETPGGLKIQTIHSFCASILRRFPLEAGVSPNFTEIDDRTAKLMRAEVLEQVAQTHPDAMAGFARHFTGAEIDDILRELVHRKQLFKAECSDETLATQIGFPLEDLSESAILSRVFDGSEGAIFDRVIPALLQGKASDLGLAQALMHRPIAPYKIADLTFFEDRFLSGPKAKNPFMPKGYPPTKDARSLASDAFDAFDEIRNRVAEARPVRLAEAAFQKTRALRQFADRYLPAIEQIKLARGWLDFDDLIYLTRDLLQDANMAAWVLFRLDGGIDHILVDEAQDTSPPQWDVVRCLADEFTSGDSARSDVARTLFVVGDQKQSIYSFQGADPAGFETMRADFEAKHAAADKPFSRGELLHSFRSAPEILQLVDATFTADLQQGMGGGVSHLAFKQMLPGRVDLWPWIDTGESEEMPDWHSPVDTVSKDHHTVQLAEKIANFIKAQIAHGQLAVVERKDGVDHLITRRVTAGDFLVLVQKRSGVFHPIIQECKRRNIPLAGADRLKMGGELGVKDLAALLAFLATQEDDLSLATVLRSPLGGVSEEQLYTLAQGRGSQTLWRRLEDNAAQFPDVHAMLRDLRDQVGFLRPFELLERALTRHHGREKLIARLGNEAEEGIEALLTQALGYEQLEVPSLTGFLTWLETDDVDIKRQIDSNSDLVRVMTVHGAKGLEAPIVILPETGPPLNTVRQGIFDADGSPQWAMRSDDLPQVQADLKAEIEARQIEERRRLLYVAMTRAENRLIVCGSGDLREDKAESWYRSVKKGMGHAGAVPDAETGGMRLGLDWPKDLPEAAASKTPHVHTLPDWTSTRPPEPLIAPEPLNPSNLGGEKVIAGDIAEADRSDDAKARGTALHLLLEVLPSHPRADWDALAAVLAPDASEIMAEVARVLDAPELSHVFAPDTLAEVGFTAELPELNGAVVTGSIDRLVTSEEWVLAVDFKSNQIVPHRPEDIPEGILRQMGAYQAALAQLYPNHQIETAILWTKDASLMTIPHDIVRNALLRTIHLDAEPVTT